VGWEEVDWKEQITSERKQDKVSKETGGNKKRKKKRMQKTKGSKATVAHACNPNYLGGRIRRIAVPGQHG
jgi:hypothetical protein